QLEKCFARDTAFAQGTLKNSPELSLEQSILITQLLFFAERYRVIGLLAPGASRTVNARRIIFPLQCFRRTEDRHAITPAHFCLRSCVSGHFGFVKSLKRFRPGAALADDNRCAAQA